jgi:hypothetical protein
MSQLQQPRRRIIGQIVALSILVGLFTAFWYRNELFDMIAVARYAPSSEMSALATRTTMTTTAKNIFYTSTPTVDGTQRFNEQCGSHEKNSVTLGCYAPQSQCNVLLARFISHSCMQITLYNVTDAKLDGIMEVTAAHEMLHAAYARVSSSGKHRLAQLLTDEQKKLADDASFNERMSVYADLTKEDQLDELHSIIGTEVALLPAELEAYYRTYFVDRSRVVTMYRTYADTFLVLRQQANQLAQSLDQQALEITSRSNAYNQAVASLNSQIREFNQRAQSGYFTSRAAFDAERTVLEQEVLRIQTEQAQLRRAIDTYNSDKQRYETAAGDLSKLNNSIDSNLAPIPTV